MVVAWISWRVDIHRQLFGITYFPHGVLIAVGFLAGTWVLSRYARRHDVTQEALWDIATWVIIGSLIGTRLVWVLGNWSELSSPAEALMIWHGGMTLYGGILGGLLAGLYKLRRHQLPVWPMLDAAAPALALGLVIGRASDLITGDHLGKPTGLPWGFRYVGDNPPGVAPPLGAVVHPVALYDLVSVTVLLLVLVWFLRRRRTAGSAAALFALWYATGRVGLDFLRTDPARALGLTGTQLASVAVILVTVAWLAARARQQRTGTQPPTDNALPAAARPDTADVADTAVASDRPGRQEPHQ